MKGFSSNANVLMQTSRLPHTAQFQGKFDYKEGNIDHIILLDIKN